MVQRENELQDEQEEIGPRPFVRRAVEAEPQIQDLQRADDPEEADKRSEHQRDRRQQLGRINDRREQIEIRQDDVVDEIGLQRDRRRARPGSSSSMPARSCRTARRAGRCNRAAISTGFAATTSRRSPNGTAIARHGASCAAPEFGRDISGDRRAGDQQQPERRRVPGRLGQKGENVGQRDSGFIAIASRPRALRLCGGTTPRLSKAMRVKGQQDAPARLDCAAQIARDLRDAASAAAMRDRDLEDAQPGARRPHLHLEVPAVGHLRACRGRSSASRRIARNGHMSV